MREREERVSKIDFLKREIRGRALCALSTSIPSDEPGLTIQEFHYFLSINILPSCLVLVLVLVPPVGPYRAFRHAPGLIRLLIAFLVDDDGQQGSLQKGSFYPELGPGRPLDLQ